MMRCELPRLCAVALLCVLILACGPRVLSLGTNDAGVDVDDGADVSDAVDVVDVVDASDAEPDAEAPACICYPDLDTNEVLNFDDVNSLRACMGLPPTGACRGADLDCDGTVGPPDGDILTCLLQGYSDCCPDAVVGCGCNGNVNRDGATDALDGEALGACVGQAPTGTCAKADLDCSAAIDACDVAREECILTGGERCCMLHCSAL